MFPSSGRHPPSAAPPRVEPVHQLLHQRLELRRPDRRPRMDHHIPSRTHLAPVHAYQISRSAGGFDCVSPRCPAPSADAPSKPSDREIVQISTFRKAQRELAARFSPRFPVPPGRSPTGARSGVHAENPAAAGVTTARSVAPLLRREQALFHLTTSSVSVPMFLMTAHAHGVEKYVSATKPLNFNRPPGF